MKIQLSAIIIVAILGSCSSNTDKSTKTKVVAKKSISAVTPPTIKIANGTRLKDTMFITGKSAVSFWLDSAEMERRHKKEGDDFVTGADDASAYATSADFFLHKQNLPVVQADGSRFLKFVQTNGAMTLIKTDTLPYIHTLYFFDPNKKLYNADITVIEDEYKKFFH